MLDTGFLLLHLKVPRRLQVSTLNLSKLHIEPWVASKLCLHIHVLQLMTSAEKLSPLGR